MPSKITPERKRVYHLNYTGKPETRVKLRVRAICVHAIRSGRLQRLPCEGCGEVKSEAHHDDYSKPVDVRWLCRKCHGRVHRKSHCIRGHLLPLDTDASGRRACLACKNIRCRKQYAAT